MADLDGDEQRFDLAHPRKLDLIAQAGTQHLFVRTRDPLEEFAEGVAPYREARRFRAGGERR